MVFGTIAKIIGPAIRGYAYKQAGNLYQVLRAQDRIVDYTYRKSGLYNRRIVSGIKHGLAGGQIIGGTLKLGLAEDTPGNGGSIFQPKRKQSKAYKSYKTRKRYPVCPSSKYNRKYNYKHRNR